MSSQGSLYCAWQVVEIKQIPPFPFHSDLHAQLLLYKRVIQKRKLAWLKDLNSEEHYLLQDVRYE